MKKSGSPLLATVQEYLFGESTPSYSLIALLALALGGTIVFGSSRPPGVASHLVMLATALCSSRIFRSGWLRWVWLAMVGFIGLMLLLDVLVP